MQTLTRRRSRLARPLSWLVVAGLAGAALIGPGAGGVGATSDTEPGAPDYVPNSGHTSSAGLTLSMGTATINCTGNSVNSLSGSFTFSGAGAGDHVVVYLAANNGSNATPLGNVQNNEATIQLDGKTSPVHFTITISSPFTASQGGILIVFASYTEDTKSYSSKSNSLNCGDSTTTTTTDHETTTSTTDHETTTSTTGGETTTTTGGETTTTTDDETTTTTCGGETTTDDETTTSTTDDETCGGETTTTTDDETTTTSGGETTTTTGGETTTTSGGETTTTSGGETTETSSTGTDSGVESTTTTNTTDTTSTGTDSGVEGTTTTNSSSSSSSAGGVKGVTATPPATDTIASATTPAESPSGLRLVLLGMAFLLAMVLLLQPRDVATRK